jgi:hypothetical protein
MLLEGGVEGRTAKHGPMRVEEQFTGSLTAYKLKNCSPNLLRLYVFSDCRIVWQTCTLSDSLKECLEAAWCSTASPSFRSERGVALQIPRHMPTWLEANYTCVPSDWETSPLHSERMLFPSARTLCCAAVL